MRAAMHRAFTTWSDAHPLLNFIDVTEECRRVYGAVHSNCSMAEIFITHRDSTGISTSQFDGIKHPKPWPRPDGSEPYPYGKVVDNKFVEGADNVMKCRVVGAIPYIPSGWGEAIDGAACKAASAGLQGMADVANTGLASIGFAPAANALTATTQNRKNAEGSEITLTKATNSLPNWGSARRRALGVDPADDDLDLTVDEGVFASPGRRLQDGFDIGANIGGGTAAASATQYGRYAQDLRSTNGMTQCKTRDAAGGNCTAPFSAIEAYGGIVSFNTEKCWYLDSSFCAPLHGLKASMGKENAHAMVAGIAWGTFGLAALILAMLTIRIMRHQHCCHAQQDMTFKQKFRASAEEVWSLLLPCGLSARLHRSSDVAPTSTLRHPSVPSSCRLPILACCRRQSFSFACGSQSPCKTTLSSRAGSASTSRRPPSTRRQIQQNHGPCITLDHAAAEDAGL